MRGLASAFRVLGDRDLARSLTDPELTPRERMDDALVGLAEHRLFVLLDNFESVLDLETRQIVHDDLREAYQQLAERLTVGSRVVITSRYRPANTPDPASYPTLAEESLADFDFETMLRFLRREPKIDRRIRYGELRHDLLQRLHDAFGGAPRFLAEAGSCWRRLIPANWPPNCRGKPARFTSVGERISTTSWSSGCSRPLANRRNGS